jgi:hypothetical protein
VKQFADSAGRAWTISLTIDAVKRVRGLLGAEVDLLKIEAGNPPLLTRLTDIEFLCNLIFALIKPQAEKLGVTDEQFGAAMDGDCLKNAQDALYGELVDFFQKLGRRDLVKAVDTQGKIIDQAVDAQSRMLDEAAKKFTTRIEHLEIETLEKTFGPPSIPSPESSA